ncbi:DUF4209 domain-containing protein [Virgibacillus litoralis]|uniref:DUF4209 domain-containing protein n=1 Tax=Virgibacillus litoralis TaxID=578221 RepID=A0ABS4HIC4_9BACI|nr:DUF4209 domain-containing protein [Virgibacillus litoralis]MBP1950681.1 hypothetical protein [Virgibacillus litoralis]
MNQSIINIINEAIRKAKSYECFDYRQELLKLTDGLDGTEKEVIQLITDILSYHMNKKDPKQPFEPYAIFDGKKSAALSDLSQQDIKTLINLYPYFEDSEIKARISDVIWTRNKIYKYGQDAIDNYLISAARLEDWDQWTVFSDKIERALQLALFFGRDNDKVDQVNTFIKEAIIKINGEDPLYLTGKLVELLLEQKDIDVGQFIIILESKVLRNLEETEYSIAKYYMELLAKCYQRLGNNDKYKGTIERIAMAYEEEAEYLSEDGNKNNVAIIRLLEDAIKTYRKIPGKKQKNDEILSKLEIFKKKMSENLQQFSHNMDITNVVTEIEKSFRGKEKLVCIAKLAFIQSINTKSSLEKRVNELHKSSPIAYLVNREIIDNDGKRIISMPDLNSGSEEERMEALEAHMLMEAANNHSIQSGILINHALRIISNDHEIDRKDIEFLVTNNMFVPLGREKIFVEGLYEGFKGNFLKAIHLLIPQIENSFREIARMCGDIVTTYENDGKEQAKSLNSIFELPNFVAAFDKDLLFDLRSLLTEKYGSNMRNKLAHGLLSYEEASSSTISLYVWWIGLRLCSMYSDNLNQYISENKKLFV